MDKLLLRPLEAAAMIGVGRTRIYGMIADKTLPIVRIGSSPRIPLAALNLWVEGLQVPPDISDIGEGDLEQ